MIAEVYVGLPITQQNRIKFKIAINSPEGIIDAVCSTLELRRKDLISSSRKRELAEGRAIAIGIIRIANPKMSLKNIGKIFGDRHHSTVIYNIELFNDLYKINKAFTKKVEAVKLLTNVL